MQSASAEPALGTILLVDDDLELSDTMSEFLKIHGYATLQAQNGQNAIDLLKTMAALPLLIVLDMSMPVLDGRGFLKRRVKDPVLLGIPVVVVSGSDAPASPPPLRSPLCRGLLRFSVGRFPSPMLLQDRAPSTSLRR
jgi:CheY-like chemotaxis protein